MHTTVDDNPLRADNPCILPHFPLFSLPQASVPQMTKSGINRIFQSTENIYSCSWIHHLSSHLNIQIHFRVMFKHNRYSWTAKILLLESITYPSGRVLNPCCFKPLNDTCNQRGKYDSSNTEQFECSGEPWRPSSEPAYQSLRAQVLHLLVPCP